ncbi:MAG: Secretion system C-terminal sorting domain [Bacteroidota bacterium]|jgi:hypothetical protein
MKKVLLTLVSVAMSLATFAQAPAEPTQTLSQMSGNDVTASGNGYLYQFKSGPKANVTVDSAGAATNSRWNSFDSPEYVVTHDSLNSQLLVSVTGEESLSWQSCSNRFYTGNGLNVNVNLSGATQEARKITAVVESDVEVPLFGIMIAAVVDDKFVLGDGNGSVAGTSFAWQKLNAGMNTVTFYAADSTWDKKVLDLSASIGFALLARKDFDGHTATANLKIKSITFGDAVLGISAEEVAALGLSFFPNPAENQVSVSYNSNGKSVSVVLVDANGNAVASSVNDVINTSSLASGLYYAKVFVDGEYATTSKIAVK